MAHQARLFNPMKIALLGPANVIHYQRWAYALAARDHEVHLISQHPDAAIAVSPVFASKTWLPIKRTWGYAGNVPALRRALAHIQPDIVNTHYASGYGLSASLATCHPCVLSVWGSDVYDFPYESRLKSLVLRWNLRRATAIASTSHAMARQVARLIPGAPSAHITPFGVDCDMFTPAPQRTTGPFTIGIVKTLAPTYGVDLLVRAFAQLLQSPAMLRLDAERPLRLLLVGDGPEHGPLQQLVAQLGLQARVHFAGHVTHGQVPSWLRQFDIFAAPSRSESFGVAAVEASACGLPVVVSDAGGLPEVVDAGRTGLVVARENVPALADALQALALNAPLREAMGYEGRQHVLNHYEWHRCVDQMLDCYQTVIAMARGHTST